jgi:hypothetical protein
VYSFERMIMPKSDYVQAFLNIMMVLSGMISTVIIAKASGCARALLRATVAARERG